MKKYIVIGIYIISLILLITPVIPANEYNHIEKFHRTLIENDINTFNSKTNDWYYYPKLQNYAPKGMPDFDQRQNSWRNQGNMAWSFCGPTALSNVLWYLDSEYSDPSGFPGDGNDQFPLVQNYYAPGNPNPGPSSDDHNFNNVNDPITDWNPANELYGNEFIEKIAWYTDNDGVRTGGSQIGSTPLGMYEGCVQWIEDESLSEIIDVFIHDTTSENSYNEIIDHIEIGNFVVLNLGFYTSSGIYRGNHWVTIAGISRTLNKIALSDPYYDFTNTTTDYTEHNNANIVSHDIFKINNISPLPQYSSWWIEDYKPDFALNTNAIIKDALVITSILDNQPPEKPEPPRGEVNCKLGVDYIYYASTTDPEEDDIFYLFDWGNGGTSFIMGPYESGEECNASAIWFEKGDYEVKVQAIDEFGAESEWSDPLVVSMPKTKATKTKKNNEIDSMMFCDVLIKGTATVRVIRGSFILGFGKCFYMKVDLENDGSLEISSITNPSNSVELKGSYQIHLIGFGGYYSDILKTRIDGKALLAIWG